MSLLSRFEQACASFIERAFARSFPSELAPAHVARKLVAVMEAHTRREGSRLVAPSAYGVSVNPEDFERLRSDRDYLEREWAELLRDLAARVGAVFTGSPSVSMIASDHVPLGAAEIDVLTRPLYRLRVTKGVPPGAVYRLEGEVFIGREPGVTVPLADPSVSRRHACIELVNGTPMLRDLGSRNGSFVNGETVRKERALRDGDILTFGSSELLVEAPK
ncbi:MAG: FhaA domain-containing protein [Candidatus Tyrphobacter sp.]